MSDGIVDGEVTSAPLAQIRRMDEIDAATIAEAWLERVIKLIVPMPIAGKPQPGWMVTRARVPDGQEEAHTRVITLWELNSARAMYILQRDSANFTICTMVLL